MGRVDALRVPPDVIRITSDVLYGLPDSARMVLDYVVDHHPLTPQEIEQRVALPARTVRWALRRLRDDRLVQARLDLDDLRHVQYTIHPARIDRDALRAIDPDHPLLGAGAGVAEE